MENRKRRKNYFIKRKFQAGFIVKFCGLLVAASMLSGIIIYMMSGKAVTTAFENSRLVVKSAADFILPAVFSSGLAAVVIMGVAAIMVTMYVSHRIAGPLYRMEKDIQEVAGGNLNKRFGLRSTDELKALAESLDAMVTGLRQNIGAVKTAASELEKELAGEAKEKAEKLRKALDKFSL